MSGSALPPIEAVAGGSHGMAAGYDQMLALADRYERHAGLLADMAGLGARVMADGDLLESSLLSPTSFADAELQVLDATTGADGLTVRILGIEADALGVRAVVAAFRAGDALSRHTAEMVDHSLGRLAGCALPVALPALLVAGGVTYAHWSTLSQQEQDELGERIADDLGQLVHDHPGLAQHVINSGGGLVESLVPGAGLLAPGDGPIGQATTNDAARLMALLLGDDTDSSVVRRGDLDDHGAGPTAPAGLEDLVHQLAATQRLPLTGEVDHGAIQVQQVGRAPDERYIVYLPGTEDMRPVPAAGDRARDMETNYQLIGRTDSSYGHGIQEAMTEAGLAGKEVMLVGHSQGGMVATSLAADPDFARHFDVRHVVTAGSPTAQVPYVPDGTGALHLENRGDAVPLLDGEDNPDQPLRTTVRFDAGDHDVVDNHGLDRYALGAAAVDASSNGSIRDQLDRMRDDGFLGAGSSGPVQTWVITR
ncbi:hypothetical protein GCM10011376_30910 [Nocardioides flavus (ex Wang et al. 2016)]|uniref:GPI inositol-deacylase PGAP1-like alpha/beta domain-containing protein n=1 Tax=Nocardioides flavus (ex Wang et al. 2016) TaxID=2058780 RepID=A0ABQ3HP23_9ACTN|nr:hypothetical protein [Nocardioides flavus (ex Wang et al. 2016)]GHE18481.1 hypothetical protein GCM10011376_30910 [Nocardioides flavus (ex Wang et al. 2016)]